MIHRRHILHASLAAPLAATPFLSRAAAPIVIGQSAALSGSQAVFGLAMRDGMQAAFSLVNASGGVGGRQVTLQSLDDVGDKAKTEANIKVLLNERNAVGLAGLTTRPCSEQGAKMAAAQGVALIGAFSGTPLLYGAEATTTYTTRASYEQELRAIVKHYRTLGTQKFGFVHLEDSKATNVPLLRSILDKEGGTLAMSIGVDRNGSDMNAAALAALVSTRPDTVIILANNKPLLPLLRDYAPKTVGLPKVIISFVDRQLLLKDLGAAAAGVAFSSVVPEIHKEKFSSVRDFVQAAKRSGIAATQISLEGYITGLAVIEGLRNAKNDTRTALIDGISNVRDLDLSYTRLQFTKGNRGGSNFVSLAVSNGDSVIA